MTLTVHRCHANACSEEAHNALPFCKRHFNMLPEKHRKRLWKERRRDENMTVVCAACDPSSSDEVRLRRSKDWDGLYHLGLAIILKLEFSDCGAPDTYRDEEGYCWACGIADEKKNLATADKVIKKFGLKAA